MSDSVGEQTQLFLQPVCSAGRWDSIPDFLPFLAILLCPSILLLGYSRLLPDTFHSGVLSSVVDLDGSGLCFSLFPGTPNVHLLTLLLSPGWRM